MSAEKVSQVVQLELLASLEATLAVQTRPAFAEMPFQTP
jgi:hypothetical protein